MCLRLGFDIDVVGIPARPICVRVLFGSCRFANVQREKEAETLVRRTEFRTCDRYVCISRSLSVYLLLYLGWQT